MTDEEVRLSGRLLETSVKLGEARDCIEALEHDITRQMAIATEYLNRCDALEKALREIAELSRQGWPGTNIQINSVARAALKEGE